MKKPEIDKILKLAKTRLTQLANPSNIKCMQKYMKTTMPFYGCNSGNMLKVTKEITNLLKNKDKFINKDYNAVITALWKQEHREEKHIAINLAKKFPKFVVIKNLKLFEMMIREGAWWDFTDDTASNLIGEVLRKSPKEMWPILDK